MKASDIINVVSLITNVSESEMRSKSRLHKTVLARQIAMYYLSLEGMTFKSIGREFGNRDHSTVTHSIRTIHDYCNIYPQVSEDVEEVGEIITLLKEVGEIITRLEKVCEIITRLSRLNESEDGYKRIIEHLENLYHNRNV